MKNKILLIYCRFNQQVTYRVPLGIAYLAAILKEKNMLVVLRDGAFYNSWENVKKDLLRINPKYVGLSASSFLVHNTVKYVKLIKEILPNSIIILGGPHASALEEESLNDKNIDFAIFGEGENTLPELIDSLEKNKPLDKVKGVIFRKNNKIIKNDPRELIDLDKRPLPARDLLHMKMHLSVAPTLPLPYPATDIEASRGCIGNCKYCQPVLRKMFGKKIRSRDPIKVVDEIEYLIKKYRVKGINIGNDEPLMDKEWVKIFCKEILKRKLKVKFISGNRVDTVYEEIMPLMKKAGFIGFSFGVESGSQKILDSLYKGWSTPDKIERAFRLCDKYGICGRANIMVGSPGETRETLRDTERLLKKIKPAFIYLAATCPTPGSYLYEEAKKENILQTEISGFKSFDAGYLKLEDLSTNDIINAIRSMSRLYKKLVLTYIFNPIEFWRKRYLFKTVSYYFWCLLRNPKHLLMAFVYYLNYGKHIKKVSK